MQEKLTPWDMIRLAGALQTTAPRVFHQNPVPDPARLSSFLKLKGIPTVLLSCCPVFFNVFQKRFCAYFQIPLV